MRKLDAIFSYFYAIILAVQGVLILVYNWVPGKINNALTFFILALAVLVIKGYVDKEK